jgi:hypothetical protein
MRSPCELLGTRAVPLVDVGGSSTPMKRSHKPASAVPCATDRPSTRATSFAACFDWKVCTAATIAA